MHLKVDVTTTPIKTWNVLAEKKGRVKTQDVVVGAHLDSVDAGPGINDNGSGTATILTIAEQFTNLHIRPRNTVRFAFWGAEEEGLVGSTHYVDTLSEKALAKIALNLNFDMLGSPNFVRFVYDGDGTLGDAGPSRLGSDRRGVHRLLRPPRSRKRPDALRRPFGLSGVHRRRHPGRRAVLGCGGDQDAGAAGRATAARRARPTIPAIIRPATTSTT